MSDSARADALLANLPRTGRGRLKVFLGAAPGVGKTFAMLQAAHAQQRQGVQVQAGVVETHGRAETEALLAGLQQQPLLRSQYRGVTLEEMDLDGLLQAAPALALVDELAHTNAPGSRHAKRWQDVQELLAAGIDVYTTVNVQHLESLNDKVRDITGVQVRETLPDWVLQEAFELVLIDLPPRELLERLREGKVYVPEQARRPSMLTSRKPTSPPCANWPCKLPLRRWMPTLPMVIVSVAKRPRPCAGAFWWAWTATTRPNAWYAMPAAWRSAATCPGAWCMWTTAACATKPHVTACRPRSNWPSAWAARWCC